MQQSKTDLPTEVAAEVNRKIFTLTLILIKKSVLILTPIFIYIIGNYDLEAPDLEIISSSMFLGTCS